MVSSRPELLGFKVTTVMLNFSSSPGEKAEVTVPCMQCYEDAARYGCESHLPEQAV